MTKGRFIAILVLLGCAAAVWAGCSRTRRPTARPNVIVILVDTLRADYLGCYGFAGDVSPHIDEFAARSVRFANCSSQSPWTAPSVGSLFTSRYPFPVPQPGGQFRISVLPEHHETLAESLQNAGYETRAFVENGLIIPQAGFSQGFDRYQQKRSASEPFNAFVKFFKWFESRKEDRPFFAYIHVMDVHGPYRYLEENFAAIADSSSLGPERELTATEIEERPGPIGTFVPWADAAKGSQRRAWRGAYAAGIRLFDQKFGEQVEQLEAAGLFENSLIIFTSDHGEQLLDHGGWGHGHNLHHYQTNVPLMVHYPPYTNEGKTIDEVVSLIDLTPTIAEICGLTAAEEWEGESLVDLLDGGTRSLLDGGTRSNQVAFATSIIGDPYIFSIRSRDRLLIYDGRERKSEMFDITLPSWQREDLASAEPESAKKLGADLQNHIRRQRQQDPAMGSLPMPEDMIDHVRELGYLK